MSILCSMVGASFVTAVAEVIRRKIGVSAVGNAQISTAQSQFGGASALFDGNGDYLQLANYPSLTFSGNFTLECWYRVPSTNPAGNTPFFFNDHLFYLANDGGVMKYAVFAGGNNRLLTTTLGTISANTWYHVAFQRNGSTLSAYHNGTLISSSTYSSTMTSQTANYIGFYPGSTFFNGHIDEYRISNIARYSSNFTPSTAPFVNDANTLLLLHMDGTNATTFFEDDNGVRAQRGIRAVGNAQISTAQSQFGGASALFDGSGDYLQIANAGLNLPGDFTIEFWARHAAVNDQQVYFDFRAGGTDHIIFYIRSDNRLEYYDDAIYTTTNTFAANTWYHMALSRSSGTLRLFVNGTQQWSNSNSRNHVNSGLVWIGTSNDALAANSMNGHIDEFRVSNSARYTANFTAPTAPFVNDANTLLLIHFDGTNGSTVFRDDNGTRAPKGCIAVGQAQIDNAQSQFGGTSALFDGFDSRVQIQNHPDFALGTGDFTIEGWYRFHTSANRYNTIFNGSSNAVFPHVFTSTSGDSPPNRFVFVGGSTPDIIQGTQVWAINQWYHIALSRSSGTTRLFINGTLEGSVTNTANYTGSAVNLGASSTLTSDLMGWVDEFRISNIARYTANFTPPTAPFQNDANTLVLLHMDGTDASTVFIDDNGTRPT